MYIVSQARRICNGKSRKKRWRWHSGEFTNGTAGAAFAARMTTTLTLGRLAPVDVRSVWEIEDRDFTPWLARPENIALLAETLQLGELEIEATERDVGRFSADMSHVTRTKVIVLIENQLEITNHKHLGQFLTYLVG